MPACLKDKMHIFVQEGLEQVLMNSKQKKILLNRQNERVDLSSLSESVCLVWKHNPLEHETLEGKPEKRGYSIAQSYPKHHKTETQYTADSLLITLAGWAAT